MNTILKAISDLVIISTMGLFLTTFVLELKNELSNKLSNGSPKLSSFTNKLTGNGLDLSDKRVYGN